MEVDADPIDGIVDLALDALEHNEPTPPSALRLLVRRYVTGREDVGDALSLALGNALEAVVADGPNQVESSGRAADWVWLFLEAAAVSDDDRLMAAAAALVSGLCREWPLSGSVDAAMRSLDACLCASQPIGRSDLVASIIDELERIVGLIYRPGLAVTGTIARTESDAGDLMDHSATASALLTAYSFTERLPYSMLAEELMQVARRHWWDGSRGAFAVTEKEPLDGFLENCEAARVLCRLAALHADTEYRQAAVVATDGDYAGDVARILEGLASTRDRFGLAAAPYGLALIEFSRLT